MNHVQFYCGSKRSKRMAAASVGVVVGVIAVAKAFFTRSLEITYLKKATELGNKRAKEKLVGT